MLLLFNLFDSNLLLIHSTIWIWLSVLHILLILAKNLVLSYLIYKNLSIILLIIVLLILSYHLILTPTNFQIVFHSCRDHSANSASFRSICPIVLFQSSHLIIMLVFHFYLLVELLFLISVLKNLDLFLMHELVVKEESIRKIKFSNSFFGI